MTLPAASVAFWLTAGITAALLIAIIVAAPLVFYFAAFDNGAADIDDVQRFQRLTEEARRLSHANGSSPNGHIAAATMVEIARFQAKKDEARKALWASRVARR